MPAHAADTIALRDPREGEHWVDVSECFWSRLDVAAAERRFGATYLGDFCVRTRGGAWSEVPVATFWCAEPNLSKGHKAYFGLFMNEDGIVVCDATVVSQVSWNAVQEPGGALLLSRWRHDCRTLADESAMVDGGQDYCRSHGAMLSVRIDGPAMARNRLPGGRLAVADSDVTRPGSLRPVEDAGDPA